MKARAIHLLINYSVREGKSDDNETLIKNLIGHFTNALTDGIRHTVYKTGSRSYTHICYYANNRICNQVTSLPTFRRFLDNLESIVDLDPIVANIKQIGYYNG